MNNTLYIKKIISMLCIISIGISEETIVKKIDSKIKLSSQLQIRELYKKENIKNHDYILKNSPKRLDNNQRIIEKKSITDKRIRNNINLSSREFRFINSIRDIENKDKPKIEYLKKFENPNTNYNSRDEEVTIEIYFCTDFWAYESSFNLCSEDGCLWGEDGYSVEYVGSFACASEYVNLDSGDYTLYIEDAYGDGGLCLAVYDEEDCAYVNWTCVEEYSTEVNFSISGFGGDCCIDCEGNSCSGYESWIGDGYCDDGIYGLYFDCEEFDCDNGDCEDECGVCGGENILEGDCVYDFSNYGAPNCDYAWDEYGIDCSTLESNYGWDCEGCACPGDNEVECPCDLFDCIGQEACGYESWIGDGYCDDGAYGLYFDCPEFYCDDGDCDTELVDGECISCQFFDCNGTEACGYEGWIGDEWCDNGEWGLDFECPQFDCDAGACGTEDLGDGTCGSDEPFCGNEICDENEDCTCGDCECSCEEQGLVEDCSGDGDCINPSWIGDGFCDDETQPYGADLSCYDNDDGDCDDPEEECGIYTSIACSEGDFCNNDSTTGDGSSTCESCDNYINMEECYGDGLPCEGVRDCVVSCFEEAYDPESCEDEVGCLYDYTEYGAPNCDAAWDEYGVSCGTLEGNFGWDCSGCSCPGDNPNGCEDGYWDCGDGQCIQIDYVCDGSDEFCNANWPADCVNGADEGLDFCGYENECVSEECIDCNYDYSNYGSECCDTAWDEYGIDCSTLESNYGWDCTGCSCVGDVPCEFYDCFGQEACGFEGYIGDGWCDNFDQEDGGLNFECPEFNCDGGDCGTEDLGDGSCGSEEPYCGDGICDENEDCTCNDCEECTCADFGYYDDCSGDGDCWSESWIGDGYCDDETQPYGADLSCYDNDGGDCDDNNLDYPSCLEDCYNINSVAGSCEEFGGNDNSNECMINACTIISSWNGSNCYNDCDICEDPMEIVVHACISCLDAGDCNNLEAWYDQDALLEIEAMCSDGMVCDPGYIDDCSGDGDCIDESWIGDGYCDDEAQLYGADLSCYDNDGGDCDEGECSNCLYDYTNYGSECCDTAWEEYGINCEALESNYSWDCAGCECPGDGCFFQDCSGADACGYESWIGDGYCDDGIYGLYFDCDLFECDNGDCNDECEVCNGNNEPNTGICDCCGIPGGDNSICYGDGDLNLDGTMNVLDIVLIVDAIVGETNLEICESNAADYNEDSTINVLDVISFVDIILSGSENEPLCDEGYVSDCSDDDCCPESYIGDGYGDCEDQAYGCDLSCYDNDSGDCDDIGTDGGSGTCSDCQFNFIEYGSECCDSAWIEFGLSCSTLEADFNWDCAGCICPGDDPDAECSEDTLADCSGDGDCCPASWVSDGFGDCEDQEYGCDLTCYDNDGGDCIDEDNDIEVGWHGPGCMSDCDGVDDLSSGNNFSEICEIYNNAVGENGILDSCLDDCTDEELYGEYEGDGIFATLDSCNEDDSDDSYDNIGPPECIFDCPNLESLLGNSNPMESCQIFISWDGDNCLDDCDEQISDELTTFIGACYECIDIGDCESVFDHQDDDEHNSNHNDFDCEPPVWDECPTENGCVGIDNNNEDCECECIKWSSDSDFAIECDIVETCNEQCPGVDQWMVDSNCECTCYYGQHGALGGCSEYNEVWTHLGAISNFEDCEYFAEQNEDINWEGYHCYTQTYCADPGCYQFDNGTNMNFVMWQDNCDISRTYHSGSKNVFTQSSFTLWDNEPRQIESKDWSMLKYNPRNSQYRNGINKGQGIIKPLKNEADVIKKGIGLDRKDKSVLKQAQSVKLIKSTNSLKYESDGFVGFEMTLIHDLDFSIEITKSGFIGKAFTSGNKTKVIIINHESDELFTTTGHYEIVDIIAATLDGVQLEAEVSIFPEKFAVSHAFPNPFNPSTSFEVSIPEDGFTTISVYNIMGQKIETIYEGELNFGAYIFTWSGKHTASGIYLLRLEWEDNISIQKLILMK